ncbi:hypothetical protein H5410_026426 [Solanum commersonii]|uniref:Uncharacterized protein n=1 Tax=Solanum commersonii TaxID=4109 RepID=A0A9J5Z1H7_SOLCO|nr:hypothetical protein H5410_026426 [Solanum commersonii]
MKHVITGTQGGTGRLRTHLIKCNKECARLDDIEKANRNGIPIPENSMGAGEKFQKKYALDEILYLKCLKLLIFIKSWPRSDDIDDWMDDYLELESSTNNNFDSYFNQARKRLGMKKDNFKLKYISMDYSRCASDSSIIGRFGASL